MTARNELLIFGAKDWIINTYKAAAERVEALKQKGVVVNLRYPGSSTPFVLTHVVPLLQNGVSALLYLIVAFQPEYFGMSISELTFVQMSVEDLLASISQFQHGVIASLNSDLLKIRNLFECMEMKSAVAARENPAEYKSRPGGMKIEVKNLTFSYYETGPPVLDDVNFTIEPGQIVSVVGYNGSGHFRSHHLLNNRENNSDSTSHSLRKANKGEYICQ